MNQEVFAAVADALEKGEPAALVTIVSTTGSTPQRVGAKMLVFADGRTAAATRTTRSGRPARRSRTASRR
jgi:xanthine/CO dehydrogenase XdhC/CoxF family maturation factor